MIMGRFNAFLQSTRGEVASGTRACEERTANATHRADVIRQKEDDLVSGKRQATDAACAEAQLLASVNTARKETAALTAVLEQNKAHALQVSGQKRRAEEEKVRNTTEMEALLVKKRKLDAEIADETAKGVV